MSRTSPSPHWLTLAVLAPLVVMGVLAWMGLKAQEKAAWAAAREEAERLAPVLAEGIARDMEGLVQSIPIYPDPPVPGVAAECDAVLDGSDATALAALRDDPQAGLSPAGLPRRALAVLRLHELDPAAQTKEEMIEFLTNEVPSVLTSAAFRRFGSSGSARLKWLEDEEIRAMAGKGLDNTWSRHRWMECPVFVRAREGRVDYILLLNDPFLKTYHSRGLPKWANAVLFVEPEPDERSFVATAEVPFGKGLKLGIMEVAGALENPLRRQRNWTQALLCAASVAAVAALIAIHVAMRRERRLSELKSQFVASVSHELRAPVASIRLMADALEEEKVDAETAREFHRLIAREGARLSTLVANVLDHARIEQGRKVWRMEPCDLTALTADTLRVMEPLANEKDLALAPELAEVEATVDAGAIQQALVNLLDNAIKFSPRGGKVDVALSKSGESFLLSVRDEGPGIPQAEQERIFERFYRPGDELRRETQGTGIGLSLVKAIAQAHGGRVELESSVGNGSVFTLIGPIGPISKTSLP